MVRGTDASVYTERSGALGGGGLRGSGDQQDLAGEVAVGGAAQPAPRAGEQGVQ